MGAFLDRLRGRPRIQAARIKSVWNSYIQSKENGDYFFKVVRNVCNRDEGIRDILLSRNKYSQSEDETDFILRLLGEKIGTFFQTLLADEVLYNQSEFKRACFNMGKQHSDFSTETFKVVYWDEFTLAMLEELEDSGRVGRDDLRAWQMLLHLLNESMQEGYFDARAGTQHRNVG